MANKPARPDPHTDVAGALHDVSNALTVLLGWVAEARAPGASRESVERALLVIESRARAARDVARRAIGGRGEGLAPGMDAEPSADAEASLDAVLGEAVLALAVEAQRAGVSLFRRGDAHVKVGMAADLSHVVTNVLLNALAFSPRGSEVSLEVGATKDSVTVDVMDQGPGVPPDKRDGIFQGVSARPGGAGVGLRHARALAREAGGELSLVPSPSGALFRLLWPRVDAGARVSAVAQTGPVLRGTRVLVVEDDEHVTLLLETALGARGAVVTIARTAEELSQAIAAGEHDAALIDLSPIAADVEGAIDALRARSPDAALVFISGSAIGIPAALRAHSVRWVRKPFEVGEVVSALLSARGD